MGAKIAFVQISVSSEFAAFVGILVLLIIADINAWGGGIIIVERFSLNGDIEAADFADCGGVDGAAVAEIKGVNKRGSCL